MLDTETPLLTEKRCTQCGLSQPLESFWKRKNKIGRRSECKDCSKVAIRQYRNANPETIAANARKWRKRNPERYKINLRRHLYGLSDAAYQKMQEMQCGLCAICKMAMGKPYVDHNHVTGKVRGLLCRECNTGLGMFKDNPMFLNSAIEYLNKDISG